MICGILGDKLIKGWLARGQPKGDRMGNKRLLTGKEWEEKVNTLPEGSKCKDCFIMIRMDQDAKTLKAVGEWLEVQLQSLVHFEGSVTMSIKLRDIEALKSGRMPE